MAPNMAMKLFSTRMTYFVSSSMSAREAPEA